MGLPSSTGTSSSSTWRYLIAFSSNRHDLGDNFDIYVLTIADGSVRRITNDSASDFSPTWSPDAARLAFVSQRSGIDQLYTVDLLSGSETRVTYGGGFDVFPDWSPDGERILFSSRRDREVTAVADMDLYVLEIASGEVRRLTSEPGFDGDPRWSPRGDLVAFWSDREQAAGLSVMRSDGTELRLVASASVIDEGATP